MKQLVILFVLLLYVTGSSDLLKSISKFGDGGDSSSKFAKSPVSPFSDDSEDDDDDDDSEHQQPNTNDDDEDEIDVMAQLKSYQHKLSTTKDVKPTQEVKKKQPQHIEESESEYDYDDDDDDSGNMWSRGISKKLSQTDSKPLVLPIESAKQQIKNDYSQFTNTKGPELQAKQYEIKTQEQPTKIAEDPEKERSADFEKMKLAQLEKYSKKFHLDEPKESKSMYENDSLKEFMPKINFQPLNLQEAKNTPQIAQSQPQVKEIQPAKPTQYIADSESEEEDDVPQKPVSTQPQKNNNKSDQFFNTEAFDFLNKEKEVSKEKQKQKKIVEPEPETESESEDEEEPKRNDDEEKLILQKLANKGKIKKEKQQQQSQIVEQNFDYDSGEQLPKRKQKKQEDNTKEKEILKRQKEEFEEQEQKNKKQQVEEEDDDDEDRKQSQKKKQKKQKKQLSLEEFQNSLALEQPKQKQVQQSFAQTEQIEEHKDKKILEQKTFTLVREDHLTPPQEQKQETKVFKVQAVPKKQQEFIQESEPESESENEDQEVEDPKQINCFESKNKFIQQICQLCSSKVAYQVNQQNWQKIGMNNGFRQSFQPLIEFTFKSIGEIGSYYLSFKDHIVCLSAENLTKQTNVDKVLKHFTGNQLADYNSPIDIPVKSQPINFLLSAEYDSLLNGFSCRRFQIAIKTDLKYRLSKKNDINVKQIIFYKNKLKLKYIGFVQINGIAHQASFDQEEGGEVTNLMITQLNLPKEQGIVANLVDKYVDGNFVSEMLENQDQMLADLVIQTHQREDEIGLTFNLRKRKGK